LELTLLLPQDQNTKVDKMSSEITNTMKDFDKQVNLWRETAGVTSADSNDIFEVL